MDGRPGENVKSIRIRLYGIVQGVGFRPFTAWNAAARGITGTVRNLGASLDVTAVGDGESLEAFLRELTQNPPPNARIIHADVTEVPVRAFDAFTIEPSDAGDARVFIPADIGVCADCLREMADPDDRRFAHPFISCVSCGPRYSIIEDTPYDRHTTTMRDFRLCPACAQEYHDALDRRCHAQTVSCHDCGPGLVFTGPDGRETGGAEAFRAAAGVLRTGGILAVKGIGGYHLACDPDDEHAVARLRVVKKRERKPFAVLFPGLEAIRAYCAVSDHEEALLSSQARPIVLLDRQGREFTSGTCNGSRQVGVFLPYTPLQALLTDACGPLVMTSANASDDPVIREDDEMRQWLGELDGILWNRRRIVARQDDSVVRSFRGRMQMVRRSRGYAPLPVFLRNVGEDGTPVVLAAGGQMKSAFCLASPPFAFPGQYVGDLDSEGCLAEYREDAERLQRLFRLKPEIAAADMNPEYASTVYARGLGLPVVPVQHHHAHIASVLAEHGLEGPVIGVAFDGTGYGTDGTVWGGEFLVCGPADFRRAGHLRTVRLQGGDEGARDASRSAMAYRHAAGLDDGIDDPRWPVIRAALDNGINTCESSSMGRLFDAAAAIVGAGVYNHYEGECAVALENLAADAIADGVAPVPMSFTLTEPDGMLTADPLPLIETLLRAQRSDARALALGFHRAVAGMAAAACVLLRERTGIGEVCLSGGVFQNQVLLADLYERLKNAGFRVFTNEQVPPNDGGICLGQAYVAIRRLRAEKGEETTCA